MTKRNSSNLSIETISPYFTQNIQTAAKELGICCTLLKKICRKYGISRWPYRKIQSVDKVIYQTKERLQFLEKNLGADTRGNGYSEISRLRTELFELERKRESLLRPDKAFINPYNLEPNYRIPLYSSSGNVVSSWPFHNYFPIDRTLSTSQQEDKSKGHQIEATSALFELPSSPGDSFSSSEKIFNSSSSPVQSGSCFPETAGYNSLEFEDSSPAVTSQVTLHCEAGSPSKIRRSYTPARRQSDSYISYPRKQQLSSHEADSLSCSGPIVRGGPMSRNELELNYEMIRQPRSHFSIQESFPSPSNLEMNHLTSNLNSNSNQFIQPTRNYGGAGSLSASPKRVPARRLSTSALSAGQEPSWDARLYTHFGDDDMLSGVPTADHVPNEESVPFSTTTENHLNAVLSNRMNDNFSREGDFQSAFLGLFQRMEQLEEENSRLRSNLSQLVSRLPIHEQRL
eukprot:jgi/Galph1/2450/GphlegSOOS_G1131.1